MRGASLALCAMLASLPLRAAADVAALPVVPAKIPAGSHAPSSPVHTLYERQDHRMLPVGTKIYYASSGRSGVMTYVYPGEAVPPAMALRPPDVVVVSASDPRGADEVQRLKHPAACCPTRH